MNKKGKTLEDESLRIKFMSNNKFLYKEYDWPGHLHINHPQFIS